MSIQTDDIDTGLSDFDAVARLTQSLQGPAASEEDGDEGEGDDEDDADDSGNSAPQDDEGDEDDGDSNSDDEDDEDGEEGDDAPEPKTEGAAPAPVTDDAVVKVIVDGQETEFTVGNLKRLAGQEASLTKKSQEADVVGGRAAAVLQGALESVIEDLEPYKDIDWVLEGRRMDPEEFEWHRETYNRLSKRYEKIVAAAKDFTVDASHRAAAKNEEAAQAARAILTTDVPGWNDELEKSVRDYAVAQGLDADEVSRIVSAPVLKIIHKAMLQDQKAAAAVEKVKQAPKAVRKGAGREPLGPSAEKAQRSFAKKAASGAVSEDDAVAALMGRWGASRR